MQCSFIFFFLNFISQEIFDREKMSRKVLIDSEEEESDEAVDGRPEWMRKRCIWYHPYLDHAYSVPVEPDAPPAADATRSVADDVDLTAVVVKVDVDDDCDGEREPGFTRQPVGIDGGCDEEAPEEEAGVFGDARFRRRYEKLLLRCVDVQKVSTCPQIA
jgi:hypothetical protein